MEKFDFSENWKEKKNRLQNRYQELTDNDLTYVVGEEDKLIDRIHRRTGISRKKTRNMLREL